VEWQCSKLSLNLRGCFKDWTRCKNAETWNKYKIAKKETKKAVSEAGTHALNGLYQSLGVNEGQKSIYKLAKGRERKTRDKDQVKCIKDEEGRVLVHKRDITNIRDRWNKCICQNTYLIL